jgi:hypothetical protein
MVSKRMVLRRSCAFLVHISLFRTSALWPAVAIRSTALHVSWESSDSMPIGSEAEGSLDSESARRPTEHQRCWKRFRYRYNLRAVDGADVQAAVLVDLWRSVIVMNVCSGVVLSPSELLLTSSPSHHSLRCWYRAPLDNLSTLTDSVIDKVILEFVSNCATVGG